MGSRSRDYALMQLMAKPTRSTVSTRKFTGTYTKERDEKVRMVLRSLAQQNGWTVAYRCSDGRTIYKIR